MAENKNLDCFRCHMPLCDTFHPKVYLWHFIFVEFKNDAWLTTLMAIAIHEILYMYKKLCIENIPIHEILYMYKMLGIDAIHYTHVCVLLIPTHFYAQNTKGYMFF